MILQETLLYKTNRAYLVTGLTLYLIIFFYWGNSVNFYNILNAGVFLSYAYLIWISMDKDDEYYSNRRLAITVFTYSLLFVFLYLLMSYTYTGNTFIFSEIDARLYERLSFHIKDMKLSQATSYLSHVFDYDDWGAPIGMALLLKIVPNKLFINFCYILIGTLNALSLFSIGKKLMTKRYAYISSLAYAISSYSIFFMGSFLKEEMMIMIVLFSFYFLYKYRDTKDLFYLIAGGFFSFLLIFFRVPVAIFIWVSYASYLLFGNKSHLQKGLFAILFILVLVIATGLIQYSTDRYANSGDVTNSYAVTTTTLFQKIVLSSGAIIGPFPALLQISSQSINYKPLFGAGLLYKFLITFAFWKGAIYCFKSKKAEVYPIFLFTILEIVGLVIVFDGLELRKAMPHMPIITLAAFWYMSSFDEDTNSEIRKSPYYYWTYQGFTLATCLVFVMTLAWNTLIRIPHL